jgi:hypothetical protein
MDSCNNSYIGYLRQVVSLDQQPRIITFYSVTFLFYQWFLQTVDTVLLFAEPHDIRYIEENIPVGIYVQNSFV